MDWTTVLLYAAVLFSLYASAWWAAKSLTQQWARPPAATNRSVRCKKTSPKPPSPQSQALFTALDNLTAYGTHIQQEEMEDVHEQWNE